MIKKQEYLAPEAELLVIGIEANILSVSNFNLSGTPGSDLREDEDYDYSFN
jgi:hypothetical protein